MEDVTYKEFKSKIKNGSILLRKEQLIYVVGGALIVATVWLWYFYAIISDIERLISKTYMFVLVSILLVEFIIMGFCGIIYNKRKQARTKEEELFFSKYWIKKLIREYIMSVILLIVLSEMFLKPMFP